MSGEITLSEFKNKVTQKENNLSHGEVNINKIGGIDTQTYGLLLAGLAHFLNTRKHINIILRDLGSSGNTASIYIEKGASGAASTKDTLMYEMVNTYQDKYGCNYLIDKSNNRLGLTINTVLGDTTSKNNDMAAKVRKAAGDKLMTYMQPVTQGLETLTGLGKSKVATDAVAESTLEDYKLINEEINRIKNIMKNGKIY
jgi:hypothetical protein